MRRFFLLLVLACQSPPATIALAPTPAVTPKPIATPPTIRGVPVRVVHRGTTPGWSAMTLGNGKSWTRAMTWFQGIDAKGERAFVTHQSSNGSEEFELVTIDLKTRNETRWLATQHDARMRAFHPLTGTLEEDLVKYAAMVEATGPFVVRARDYAGPLLAVSKDRIAYETDPDELMMAYRDGSHSVRLGAGLAAAYYPTFSADGSHVAYTGCNYRKVPPGAFYTCLYHVYVAPIDGKPIESAVTQPQPPTFSPDGKYVYAVSRDIDHPDEPHDRGGCAYRIDASTGVPQTLVCTSTLHDLDLDPGPGRAVLHGWRGKIGEQLRDFIWLELPSGKQLGTISIDRGTSNATYGGGEFVLGNSQRGIVAVNLRTHDQAILSVGIGESIWLSNQWKDDHTAYALKNAYEDRAYEILEIDARALLTP